MEERKDQLWRVPKPTFSDQLFFPLSTGKLGDFVQPAFENPVQAEAGYEPKQGEDCCGWPCFLSCGTCQKKRHTAFLLGDKINHLGDANTREKKYSLSRSFQLNFHPALCPASAWPRRQAQHPKVSRAPKRVKPQGNGQVPETGTSHTAAKAAGSCAPPRSSQNYKKW